MPPSKEIVNKPQSLNFKLFITRSFKNLISDLSLPYLFKRPSLLTSLIGIIISLIFLIFSILEKQPDQIKNNYILLTLALTSYTFIPLLVETAIKTYSQAKSEFTRIFHGDIEVKKVKDDNSIEYVFTSELLKGQIIRVEAGDIIPLDGEVIEGIATIDESAITGESSPVLKDSETSSSVTGGTRIITDSLLIKITSEHGQTYLDHMTNINEESESNNVFENIEQNRHTKISILFSLLITVLFLLLTKTTHTKFDFTFLLISFIALLPTTYNELKEIIRISMLDQLKKINVLNLSEKSLDLAGKISITYIDKTGTITFGNRIASEIIPLSLNTINEVAKVAFLASYKDLTSEGKSIALLSKRYGVNLNEDDIKGTFYEFNPHARISGVDLDSGAIIRKGAVDAIKKLVLSKGGTINKNIDPLVQSIALNGGTPLLISNNNEIVGIIHLKDIVKTNIKNRFKELKDLDVKSILCTGDNKLTASVISKEVGIDEFIAEAQPQDKIEMIRKNQSNKQVVAMIGDGTNDAPALAQADIGLAMNTSIIAAKEAANMIDLDSDPTKIIDIIKLGKKFLITKKAFKLFSTSIGLSKLTIIGIFFLSTCKILNIGYSPENYLPMNLLNALIVIEPVTLLILLPISLNGLQYKKKSPIILLPFILGGLILPVLSIKILSTIFKLSI